MIEEQTDSKIIPNNFVYYFSVVLMCSLVLFGSVAPERFGAVTIAAFDFFLKYMGWWYMLAMAGFIVFNLSIAFSRFGSVKLGPPDSKPDFSTLSWIAMLFGSGMGIGLVFYSVGEPLMHMMDPPYGAEPGSVQAAEDGIRTVMFHFVIHPWACYSVVALCLANAWFRRGAPALMSSILLPLLGPKGNNSVAARIMDIFTIFATVAGVATSVGMAVMQISGALEYSFNVPETTTTMLTIAGVLTIIYTWSAVSGLDRGIKILGHINLYLVIALATTVALLGPTLNILSTLLTGIAGVATNFINSCLYMGPEGGAYRDWLGNWSIFYWAWIISWAPFVGSFIARISRGRTIREFVLGVILAPCVGIFLWISVWSGTAVEMQLSGIDLASAVGDNVSRGIFVVYENLPFGTLQSALMIVLICTFLLTSANSSTFALTMYSSSGMLNPPKSRMLIWGVLQAAFAMVLLLTGGLKALQTASIASAGPFSIIMVLAGYCMIKTLRQDFPKGTKIE